MFSGRECFRVGRNRHSPYTSDRSCARKAHNPTARENALRPRGFACLSGSLFSHAAAARLRAAYFYDSLSSFASHSAHDNDNLTQANCVRRHDGGSECISSLLPSSLSETTIGCLRPFLTVVRSIGNPAVSAPSPVRPVSHAHRKQGIRRSRPNANFAGTATFLKRDETLRDGSLKQKGEKLYWRQLGAPLPR